MKESRMYMLIAVVVMSAAWLYLQFMHVDPYMDEIFHIPQAQAFCAGKFSSWNDKITTFPGLYILSVAFSNFLSIFVPEGEQCSVGSLRFVNIFQSLVLAWVAAKCRMVISPESRDAPLVALLVYVFPFSYLYYFLYYTDTMSLNSLLVTYVMSIITAPGSMVANVYLLAFSSACIFSRQTNAVWVCFVLGDRILRIIVDAEEEKMKKKKIEQQPHQVQTVKQQQQQQQQQQQEQQQPKVGKEQEEEVVKSTEDKFFLNKDTHEEKSIMHQYGEFLLGMWTHRVRLLSQTWGLILPVVAFVIFVAWNGSIVVGDKANHVPGVHPAMLTHMLCIVGILLFPVNILDLLDRNSWWFEGPNNMRRIGVHLGRMCLLYAVIGGCYIYGSRGHAFLLADNRHYFFYLWNRLLSSFRFRVISLPAYSMFVYSALRRLYDHNGLIWTSIYLVAAALTLVPTTLLEGRYFTPGVVIALLHVSKDSAISKVAARNGRKAQTNERTGLILAVVGCVAINIVVVYIFLQRPFTWHDGSLARFMY